MRVLQIAPLWETVPPPAYGGTEAVVAILCDELVRRGVDVTLWASGDSSSRAELRSIYPRSLRTAVGLDFLDPYHWMHAAMALQDARDFDLVHNHAGELVMAMNHIVEAPMLSTMHCLITPDTKTVWERYEGWYNTISVAEKKTIPDGCTGRYVGAVYNAVDVASFPFSIDKSDYLLFLSRICEEKGVHLAVEVAKRAGRRLVIAGKVGVQDTPYFEHVVRPLIDGDRIVFMGEADSRLKRELFKRARCLLLPILWEEPFGLVTVEAMACGTPVVSFDRGAAREIMVDGETGYLVRTVDEMIEAVHQIDRIDPFRCRQRAEERFSPSAMTDAYLRTYNRVIAEASRIERPGDSRLAGC